MPAPVIKGFVEYLQQSAPTGLGISVWEGEIPRQAVDGSEITIPGTFPAFAVEMTETGLKRNWTQADPYDDEGQLMFYIWSTTREAVQNLLNQLEALLCNATNWQSIEFPGGPMDNPYYLVECLWGAWTNVQEIGLRTQASEYIYRGQVICKVVVHGAIQTR